MRAPSTPRRLLRTFLCVELVTVLAFSVCARAETPRIEDVEESLGHDPSYKVRVDAAIVLGRLGQIRSVPVLVGALKDAHASVRASAAYALGKVGAPIARDAVVECLHDPAPIVRHMAHDALRNLGGADDSTPPEPGEAGIRRRPSAPKPSFEVKAVGDPAHRAGPILRSHMRDFLVERLRPFGDVSPGQNRGTYAIDGVIKDLSVASTSREVEVTCAIQLIVSRQPGGGMFLTTSGEAKVQRPKRQWRPEQRPGMELQALEAAVRGASEDLVNQLAPP